MKFIPKKLLFLIFTLLIISCSSDDSFNKDEEKPTITVNYADGFPNACEQLKRGQTYVFKAKVTDNVALASYGLDIHHNFDHHTHDDQAGDCTLEEKKGSINPFIYIENFTIDGDNITNYELNITITIPDDADTGDYHCAYSITDTTGWQSRTSVDIKIVE